MGISFYNINMYEIELKAHVPNRKVCDRKIIPFALFSEPSIKDILTFHFQYNDQTASNCRISMKLHISGMVKLNQDSYNKKKKRKLTKTVQLTK